MFHPNMFPENGPCPISDGEWEALSRIGELLSYLGLPQQLSGRELRERAIGVKFLYKSGWLSVHCGLDSGGELFMVMVDALAGPPAVVHRSDGSENFEMHFIDYRTSLS